MLQSLKSKIVNIIKRSTQNTLSAKQIQHEMKARTSTHTEDLVSLTTLVTNHNLIELKAKVVKKLG